MPEHPAHLQELAERYRRLAELMPDRASIRALRAKAREFDALARGDGLRPPPDARWRTPDHPPDGDARRQ